MTNEQFIEVLKATITTGLGGQASPQDTDAFIDLAVDQTAVLKIIRVEKGIRKSLNLDSIALGSPVLVAGTEGTAPADADVRTPALTRRALTPVEVLAAFDVSFSFLEKSIEASGAASTSGKINDTLNRLFAVRVGKDTVLVSFSGDTTLANDTATNKALRVFDGIIKSANADAAVHDYVIPATPTYSGKTGVFNSMLKLLPKDLRDQRGELAFFVSPDVLDDYIDEIGARNTALGDQAMITGQQYPYKGVMLIPVFGLPTDKIILTHKQNLAVGFGREMRVGTFLNERKRVLEVTITMEMDADYAVGDAIVLGQAA